MKRQLKASSRGWKGHTWFPPKRMHLSRQDWWENRRKNKFTSPRRRLEKILRIPSRFAFVFLTFSHLPAPTAKEVPQLVKHAWRRRAGCAGCFRWGETRAQSTSSTNNVFSGTPPTCLKNKPAVRRVAVIIILPTNRRASLVVSQIQVFLCGSFGFGVLPTKITPWCPCRKYRETIQR